MKNPVNKTRAENYLNQLKGKSLSSNDWIKIIVPILGFLLMRYIKED